MGELARKPGAPTLPKTPLELMTPRGGDGFTILDKYLLPAGGVGSAIFTVAVSNMLRKRPAWAGIYVHAFAAISAWFGMSVIRDWKQEARMERDAVLKHYISLHPEDFPPYERKRIGELFFEWQPIR